MIMYSLALQAGGKSTRMGSDKGLVPFMGRPMLGYILDQTAGMSTDVLVISNAPEGFEQFGLPVYRDLIPDWGALGGLYTAIHYAKLDWCLVLACDMPFIDRGLLEHLASLATGFDAVVPVLAEDHIEPFRAFYRKTCLQPITEAIQAGKRRANSFHDRIRVRYVDQTELEQFDPRLETFFNVNTPEDLRAAEEMASRRAARSRE